MRWTPHDLGVYYIDIQYGHDVVVGSPFICKVFDISKVFILHDQQQQQQLDGTSDVVFYGKIFRFTEVDEDEGKGARDRQQCTRRDCASCAWKRKDKERKSTYIAPLHSV